MMDDDQQFCLRWNNHQSTLISVFDTLLENGTLVDCTLAAEGQFLKAHKVVLSACSPYFANLLKEQYDKHPIFILKDVKYQELRAMMDYMYRGEVNISQDQLAALLKAAESLQIKGLSDNRSPTSGQQQHQQQQQQQQHQKSEQHQKLNVPGIKNNSGGGGGGGSGGGGYTLEQTKRPRIGPTSIDSQDINREGSSSPTSRKRKKIRRRSVENVMDNHEHSNSSAHSIQQINSTAPMTSINTSGTSAVVSALQSSSNTQQTSVNISKKTESVLNIKQNIGGDIITTTGTTISAGNTNTGTTDDDNQNDNELMKPINKKEQNHKRKQQQQQQHEKDELLLEPKNEYDDVNETIEDLTEDPDDEDIMDEDIGQAGPSHHGGEGSSQGFPQWPADRSQDEFIMAAQDQGQQRDPQDLRTNIKSNSSPRNNNGSITSTPITVVKNSTNCGLPVQSPSITGQMINGTKQQQQQQQQKSNAGPILPIPPAHTLSISDVSDMLFEFYKANTAKAPKNNKIDKVPRQTSPSSADGANSTEIVTSTPTITITSTKIEQKSNNDTISEPHSTTITTINSTGNNLNTASKNVNGDEMVATINQINNSTQIQTIVKEFGKKLNAPFHPRIKYSSINNKSSPPTVILPPPPTTTTTTSSSIPLSLSGGTTTIHPILTSTNTSASSTSLSPAKNQLPVIVIPSSVIQSPILSTQPAAAALAAALFRDGYQNFHQQIRAQEELLKQQQRQQDQSITGTKIEQQPQQHDRSENTQNSGPPQFTPKYMQNFLRKDNRYSDENEQQSSSDEEEEDDDEGKYPEIDDIHLIEGAKSAFNAGNQMSLSMDADYMSDESHKYSMIAAHALRNLEYSLSDYGGRGGDGAGGIGLIGPNGEIESMYNCRHCGKKYRWKSTLRRHENVECGGKEPSHQCPYCPYKSKQRGNLGVHVRKHHANLPQLASKRRSKYSQPRE